eukprot:4441-Chlamydomonas_euryale.AAC.1
MGRGIAGVEVFPADTPPAREGAVVGFGGGGGGCGDGVGGGGGGGSDGGGCGGDGGGVAGGDGVGGGGSGGGGSGGNGGDGRAGGVVVTVAVVVVCLLAGPSCDRDMLNHQPAASSCLCGVISSASYQTAVVRKKV